MKAKRPGKVRAAILQWLGVPVHLTDADFWSAYANSIGATKAGQAVNESTVMSLSAAWACTRLIAESIATLPVHLYERAPGGRQLAMNHPLYRILHAQPNADTTAVQFWEAMVAAMLLRGNSLAEKERIGSRMVGLRFLAPGRVKAARDELGRHAVLYTEDSGAQRLIRKEDVWRVPGFSLDGRHGLSAIQYGASVFGAALAAQQASSTTFEKGLMPTHGFKYPKVLKPEQRADARETIETLSGAANAGRPVILEAEMDVVKLGISPADAQLLETRGFSVEEVCRWFRVDPSMVGHGSKDSNWGTGLEQKLIGFLTFTLRPWLERLEQWINKDLLTPGERARYYAEFSIEGLLRADSTARAAFYSVMVNNGVMTRDEVRVKENMPPMGGNAGVLTVQSAMVPIDSIGAQSDGNRARDALAAWLKETTNEAPSDS